MHSPSRKDKMIQKRRHDAYRPSKGKPDMTVCPECHVWFDGAHWSWESAPADLRQELCPACRRTAERFPAGFLEIGGAFYSEHRDELINLIHNVADKQRALHPMERLMQMEDDGAGHLHITTTGVHIARRIGDALSDAYDGDLSLRYADDDTRVRIRWQR